ncbi:nucleotidyltransferase family protein [Desulfonatronum sp. SC1]|uniref:nucleotidyltransferase family protein n=1 Tax=Desulfonatronum sp. SC1 TaxID=2109626 RepID=UPI000D311E02|nr:nucleotidyltransferase domain-containing protein [Desulfonatronum sp. SC1]PTN36733.1 nucleotidyltransferase [Desulfonatronum sp. SC1]
MTVSIDKARSFLKQKQQARQEQLSLLHARAVADASAIVRMIVQRYNPIRIYQWGSLLRPELFREYSDIDLAVEGVREPERFFRMFGDAERMTDFPLDLLDIEKIAPEFAEIIKMKSIVVYERENQPAHR